MSKLAIAALVFSLLICLPFVAPVVGAILAIAALVVIAGSNGRLRGKGMAVTALILSVVVLSVDIVGAIKLVDATRTMITKPVRTFVQQLEADDLAGARAALSPAVSKSVTDDELSAFKSWLKDNCGTLIDVKIDGELRAYQSGLTRPANTRTGIPSSTNTLASRQVFVDAPPLELIFDKGTFFGAPSMTLDPERAGAKGLFDIATLDGLVIIHDGEVMRFPTEK
ncbi:MAG: hypothetical protein H6819_04810 [Phycisphaerales bacterium]|nr:hypothetical protein [Phycisphaerales bacterium]MCB9856521.1 hypothetical protein [Phycisphaerales bacterium]MCB9864002.1 hypothetical protein [Phycisphaerales bacterium]